MGLWTVQPATHLIADWSDSMTTPSAPLYREIPLTRGQVALVDAEDYERLSQFSWCAKWDKHMQSFYAYRSLYRKDGKHGTVSMHREVLGLKPGDGWKCDHRNRDTLDNRKQNLRAATHAQNCQNAMVPRRNTTGYKGTSWHKVTKQYEAKISVNGKSVHLGYRRTAREAHFELYVPAALKYHGEFARTQ